MPLPDGLAPLALQHEIEQFFYAEADLLDGREWDAWLDLFTDDVRYFVPLVANIRHGDEGSEYSREQAEAAWMDEGKETLSQRVRQLKTGIHWAEEPKSRFSHLVTNLRIVGAEPDMTTPSELRTRCRFILYRNRQQDEVDLLVGKRNDTLRRDGGTWKIARREILLDQNVLLAKNLTGFF